MLICLVGSGEKLEILASRVSECLEDLGLADWVEVDRTNDKQYKKDLGITEDIALCIEEDSIDFRDMIFEWVVPEKQEIQSMFISIFGWESGGEGCSSGDCGTCATGCAH